MEYAFLAIAIVSEVIATSYLKQTEGFTKLTPSLICAAAYIVCHYTFAKSLNRINLNIGYATWCGVGLIVTSLVSIFAYSVSAGIRAWNSPRTSGTRNKSFFRLYIRPPPEWI